MTTHSGNNWTLHVGDTREVLPSLPDGSVNCCVTSPPYWGLRDYGTGTWEGGDPECEHSVGGQVQDSKAPGAIASGVRPGVDATTCRKCGAVRHDSQIGLEQTPQAYVSEMVAVFREVRRVLRDDGVLWLNLGDSYASNPNGSIGATTLEGSRSNSTEFRRTHALRNSGSAVKSGLKHKDLVGIPWMVAFALRADGWYLRSDCIWHKPNPMPESVTDRPTKSHEYLFLLSKSERYFYNYEAIKEAATDTGRINGRDGRIEKPGARPPGSNPRTLARLDFTERGRNRRTVWTVATEPYPGAHFAVMPTALVEPCILAGCPKNGTVLDPFAGAGTVLYVASMLGRNAIGIELNPASADLCVARLNGGKRAHTNAATSETPDIFGEVA